MASCSFLVHFGALGSLYGDWSDPLVDERVRLATLVEELRTLPAPPLPPVEERVRVDEGVSSPDAPDDRRARGTGREGPAPGPQGGKGLTRTGADGRFGERPSARLSAELAALDGRLAPALNGPGHAIDSVLQRAEIPRSLLEEIGRPASAGEAGRAGDLTAGGTPGVVLRPGTAIAALPGERMAWNDQTSSGASAEVKRPGGTTVPGTAPTNFICILPAPRLRSTPGGDLHACYRRALQEDPTQQGSLRVIVTVGPGGEVISAKAGAVLGNLSHGLIACVLAQVRARARFAPDSPEGAVAVMPLSFIPQASGDPVVAPRRAAHSLRR
jgi:hypothetical protein